MPLLNVSDLKMYYESKYGVVRAVDGVSLNLNRNESLGLVGESGCGKSSLAFTLMRVLPKNSKIIGGHVFYKGEDLLKLSNKKMRHVRWAEISMIFQSAMNALNPVLKVGEMAIEAIQTHEGVSRNEAKIRIKQLLEDMGLDESRINNYPHEFSGGMRQRVTVAMSLICNPQVVIADEPTTALDVIVQEQILQKIKELQNKKGIALLLISHDVSIIAETCEKIAVMYAGRLVESGRTVDVFNDPQHPYTFGLFRSFPSVHGKIKTLSSIPGKPPNLVNPPRGCRFSPRCPFVKKECFEKRNELIEVEEGHYTSCPFASHLDFEG